MPLNQIIQLVGQFLTLSVVVLTLLMLVEMRIQRRNAYRPDLRVKRANIHGYSRQRDGVIAMPRAWFRTALDEPYAEEVEGQHRYSVSLHNLGVGAARDIVARWRFDLKTAVETVARQSKAFGLAMELCADDPAQGWLRVECGGVPELIDSNWDSKQEFDFLMPASIDPDGEEIALPPFIQFLISVLVHIDSVYFFRRESTEVQGFPLGLSVSYKDMGGAEHEGEFAVAVELGRRDFRSVDPFELEHFIGRLELSEAADQGVLARSRAPRLAFRRTGDIRALALAVEDS